MDDMQREFWNELAGPRWVAAQRQMDAVLAPYADALREAAEVPAGTTLVDVGCGCGATTLMAATCSPEADVLGLDLSEPMLDLARRRAAALVGRKIRFVVGDAATHALPEGSVGRILSRFGLMFFPDPTEAFRNMRRWMAPQGKLVGVVWASREENPWLRQTMAILAEHMEVPKSDPDAPGPFALGSAERRARVFREAGWSVQEERALDQPMRVSGEVDTGLQFLAERGPASTALENAEPAQRKAGLAALRAHVEASHDGRGASFPARALRLTLTLA